MKRFIALVTLGVRVSARAQWIVYDPAIRSVALCLFIVHDSDLPAFCVSHTSSLLRRLLNPIALLAARRRLK
jgi:hypothetical protein